MNALDNALREIKFNIPHDILHIAFVEYYDTTNTILSIDERIRTKVLRPRVYVDCNLVSGEQTRIDVSRCPKEILPTNEWIFTVPKTMTGGKSILSALELICGYMYGTTDYSYNLNISTGLGIAQKMYNNMANHNLIQTSKLELIGDNTVLVRDASTYTYNYSILRCVLEYDKNLSGLSTRSFHTFSQLCILATKAYIYNTLKIKLDKGYISGGHELNSITDIVDSYSDANEQYYEFLNDKAKKVLFMSDKTRYHRFIQAQFGNIT